MICKNCEENTKGKYCQSCGQKTNTHRLNFKHFIEHDLIHGVFHLDRGLPQTIKAILLRPGQVAWDYIHGKRKKYYNFFYLLLLILGFYLFFVKLSGSSSGGFVEGFTSGMNGEEDISEAQAIKDFFSNHKKELILSWIPMFALTAFAIFRRLQLTLVEFLIPSVVAVIGASIFNILLSILELFEMEEFTYPVLEYLYNGLTLILGLALMFFPLYTFLRFIKGQYSVLGKIWRISVFYIVSSILLLLIVGLVVAHFI